MRRYPRCRRPRSRGRPPCPPRCWGRSARLAPSAKNVAQAGAAIGRDFSHELLAAAVPLAEPELQEALRRLVEAGLVFQRGLPPAAQYLFKHALGQDTD